MRIYLPFATRCRDILGWGRLLHLLLGLFDIIFRCNWLGLLNSLLMDAILDSAAILALLFKHWVILLLFMIDGDDLELSALVGASAVSICNHLFFRVIVK